MRSLLLLFLAGTLQLSAGDHTVLHKKAVVADTHNDVLLRAMRGEDLSVRTTEGHSDVVRLKEGGVDVQIFSVWCGSEFGAGRAYRRAVEMIDTLKSLASRSPGMMMTPTYGSVQKALKQERIAALIGVEGGHMIEDSLAYLEDLAARGMNYMTLTWNNSTSWATSAADETEKGDSLAFKGLTEFGRTVVRRMNQLGVMVDLSHTGERTFWDALAVTTKPVIVSHSSVHAICPSRRNLKDDQIKAVAKNNGVICINFYSGFIDSNYHRRVSQIRTEHGMLIDSITAANSDHWKNELAIDSALAPFYRAAQPSLSQLVDHIDYVAKLVGPEYVGIGSDFDGVESLPKDMDDVTFLPNITRELLKRGYSERDVRNILGENVLRVMKANMRP
ncbi:MAG: membrane dipeptidase [Bacteroidetes bacterium]|nr:membrane dipeptidase [Bacteroidota bacterium]